MFAHESTLQFRDDLAKDEGNQIVKGKGDEAKTRITQIFEEHS